MIIPESEKDSLRAFMRVESPLVTNSRSIRNEVPIQAVDADAQEKLGDKPKDYLAGIDVDNLPPEVVERLTTASKELQEEKVKQKKLAEEKDALDKLKRQEQARADRNYEKLRKHNLDKDEPVGSNGENADDLAILQNLEKEFVAMGIAPEVAKVQAKIQFKGQAEFEKRMLGRIQTGLNPALTTLGDLAATQLLQEAQKSVDLGPLLSIPEISKSVNESLGLIVQQGGTVDAKVIESLVDMAHGRYTRTATPEQKKKDEERMKPVQFNTGGGNAGGGNPRFPSVQRNNGKPVVSADTQRAADLTFALLQKGIKKGGK